KLTKLKKRKLEKHKRKQMEKKFLYRNKSVILGISAIIVLILGSFGAYSIYEYTQEGKSIVNLGDEVNFNFICYYDNGYVIDHTLVSTPNDVTVDTDLGGDQLKNSQSLLIGGYQTVSGVLIPLYWNDEMFLEEKKGETFYISIPAEDVYGPDYSPITEAERLFNVSRETEMDRYGSMDLDEFEEDYGTPEVDMELEIDDYNVKIISVGDDTVEYEFMYEEGDSIMYEYGSGQITDKTDDKFVIFYDGTTDEVFYALVGSVYLPVHIKEVTDDELAIEVDHYNYKVLIDNIDKDVIDQDDWSISDGDFVIVRYIGYYEGGEVFASSITDDIELTSDLPLDDTYEHEPLYLTVTPGTTIDGTSTVIEGFNDALKGMVAGEEKTIEVPPEEGYG
ncbi:MAG TPA: FKBP-type peptidyl-prolyl cis-trans isomerase, partial [Candidatus Methanofastidiosa archaeon]|nr:FKBP-type peptidyl-prolyl cis-trans isomerase [Candidatus Methanofastidiosa archaeon]